MKPLSTGVIISLEPSPEESLAQVSDLRISTVQVSYPAGLDNPAGIARLREALSSAGIEITSIVCGFPGDRYDDIETVRATVGLVPQSTRAERIAHVRKVAAFADALGVRRLQTHIGYVPEDTSDPAYAEIVQAMRTVCDDAAAHNLVFALETGQETAAGLRRFIEEVGRANLRVNFDPANMILYGNDNPIPALDVLAPFIDGVHCKDGRWPTQIGALGHETPLGEGDVHFVEWLEKLVGLGYRGPLTIEREISGEQQRKDIAVARDLIESTIGRLSEAATVNVAIVGLGGMGRMHFNCYRGNPSARVVAICDVDERKRVGDWAAIGLNVDTSSTPRVDLSGIKVYERYQDMLADPHIQIVDICLPTYLHAQVATAALNAGKNVVCEKPLARREAELGPLLDARDRSGRRLMVGHCLRYWGEYERTAEIIASGAYGKPVYASLLRASGTPRWSWNDWLRNGEAGGGSVLDMHIHDVDAALWWFGKPAKIEATGRIANGFPAVVDAAWSYEDELTVHIHCIWDDNQTPFRYAFRVVMEHATVDFDSAAANKLLLYQEDKEPVELECDPTLAYQREIDDFVAAVLEGRPVTKVTPESSANSVLAALEEIEQIEARSARK